MSLQTIFVTNRNINIGKSRKKHLFGNKLSQDRKIRFAAAEKDDKEVIKKYRVNNKITRTTTSIKKTYKLSLIDSGNVDTYLQSVVDGCDNDRPWVFFLHGNNQSLSKNLIKSRKIQDEYDVNIIIFSWPSFSYDPKTVPKLIIGGLLVANPSSQLLGKWVLKKAFKDKVKQYNRARKCATKTAHRLNQAFKVLADSLLIPLKQKNNPHTCLLVHSLGHFVLREAITLDTLALTDYQFNTCMLHQADEVDKDHQDWITPMSLVKNENTYITRNKKDFVLFTSGLVNNHPDVTQAFTRLGNRGDRDSEQGSQLKYIDFTGINDVGLGHGIAWDDGRSDEVDALCRPVLTGL